MRKEKIKNFFLQATSYKLKAVSGFTLLEVLIVVGILGFLSVTLVGVYGGFSRELDLDSTAKTIAFNLKGAQAKAIAGMDGNDDGLADEWGVCFVNVSSTYIYYILSPDTGDGTNSTIDSGDCSTSITSSSAGVEETIYLPAGVSFTAPAASSATLVIFRKISGSTQEAANILITISSGTSTQTITVNPIGTFNY